jgi:DNA-directed RNA polymerase specialized sigma24 family protein
MLSVDTLLQEARLPGRRRRTGAREVPGDEAARITREIGSLPERSRLALALRFYESLRPSEIGAILDLTEDAVRELLVEASRAVIERLRNSENAPMAPARRVRDLSR